MKTSNKYSQSNGPKIKRKYWFQDVRILKAAQYNNPYSIQSLIQAGSKVDEEDKNGLTALLVACSFGNLEVVKVLMNANASTSHKCAKGYDAWRTTVLHGDFKGAIISPYYEIMAVLDREKHAEYEKKRLKHIIYEESVRVARLWKTIEFNLCKAAEFLHESSGFHLEKRELEAYKNFEDKGYFEGRMLDLAELANNYGAKTGIWRRLKKIAEQIGMPEKATEYENVFRKKLGENGYSSAIK